MQRTIILISVLLFAATAGAADLITVKKTSLREQPKADAKALVEIPENIRITSTDRQELWYKIEYKAGDKTITGWVFEQDVDNLMGRSKGQLLDENKRLLAEAEQLRKDLAAEKAKNADLKKERDAQVESFTNQIDVLKQQLQAALRRIAELEKAAAQKENAK